MKNVARHTTPHTEASKRLMSLRRVGKYKNEENPAWKGDEVGYMALHAWVARKLGRPSYCQHCGSTDKKPRTYHWASVSRSYNRDLNDWIRLCSSCHYTYDRAYQRWAHYTKPECLVSDCTRTAKGRGLCAMHYCRWYRKGTYV